MTPINKKIAKISIVQTRQSLKTIFCDIYFNELLLFKGIQNADYPIPFGIYKCKEDLLGKNGISLSWLNVKGHVGIECHIANWAHELRGCTAVGYHYSHDMLLDSRRAMLHLIKLVNGFDECYIHFSRSVDFVIRDFKPSV